MKRSIRILFVVAVAVGSQFALHSAPHQNIGVQLLGLLGGIFAAVDLTQLLLALLGPLGGLRALSHSLGGGPRLFTVPLGSRRLVVRAVPLPLFHGVYQWLRAPRARTWAVVTAAYAAPVLLGGFLLVSAPTGWRPFGIVLAAVPLLELVFTAGLAGGAGWTVFRLPTAPAAALADVYLTPAEAAAHRALDGGRIDEAAALLAAAGEATGRPGTALRIQVRLARGQWERALADAGQLTPGPLPGADWATALLRARVLVCAAEAGLLPPTEYLPRLAAELDVLGSRPQAALVRADVLRLRGERQEALKASALGLRLTADAAGTANALCSRAAALFAVHRDDEAREALARAGKLLPGLARIALVEHRAAAVVLD
ncbi:hypothetical protein [Kitasatospora sp. NPDC088783]|uniref:hypothetical protein n=1 Tax=Kitasatospora sp. NPDC088783 TaxID=3364077 RepID=UPI0037F6BADF